MKLFLAMSITLSTIQVLADMDLSRTFKTKNNESFSLDASYAHICKKDNEEVSYTMFTPGLNDTYQCALTYQYFRNVNNLAKVQKARLIRYSKFNSESCKETLKTLLQKLKTLEFKCEMSGIG